VDNGFASASWNDAANHGKALRPKKGSH